MNDIQRANPESRLLDDVLIYQAGIGEVSETALRSVELAGAMAQGLGANVVVDKRFTVESDFGRRGKARAEASLLDWSRGAGLRIAVITTEDPQSVPDEIACGVVVLQADAQLNEAVLFARSGLADLLGDPDKAPLIPRGEYGAGTVAYGLLGAITAIAANGRRSGGLGRALVDAVGVLAWVNWKAAATGALGRDLKREGSRAEWPVIPCADGYVALVYQNRDWPNLVAMVGDPRLSDERYRSYRSREARRDEYMSVIRAWSETRTKQEIMQAFIDHDIPAAAVMEVEDLLADPLLKHRNAFEDVATTKDARLTPRLAHRIEAVQEEPSSALGPSTGLPLSGVRVLDLGIITAGAGVSALLADLGAEVLKIESHTYPDPFRQWAGDAVSPLFKCNNRNKLGLALDLKDEADRARFLALVETADVVVENFRRGVLDRLGLSYSVLSAANPQILLASISGQGLEGPGCGASSFGSTLEASSGFSSHVSYGDGEPYITGRNVNYPDQTVVLYAAAVITAALSRAGLGMHLDVSQRDVAVYLAGREIETASSGLSASQQVNGRAYRARDSRWLAVPETELPAGIESWAPWVGGRSAADAARELAALGIGASVVLTGSEMFADRQRHSSFVFANGPDGVLVKGFPFQLLDTPMSIHLDSPEVGQHNDDVL